MSIEPSPKTPQYKQLAEQLRGHIGSAALKPGDRMPTVAEMQRVYGVSKATIERAQKELTAQGLLVCRHGSGTYVAQSAAKRTGILGLSGRGFTAPTSSSPYWAQVIYGIQTSARESGQLTLNLDYSTLNGWEKADGVLFTDESGEYLVNNLPPGQPCVSLLKNIDGVCSVFTDDAEGIRLAVAHLLGLGHRRIAYLHLSEPPAANPRVEAYLDAMRAAGIAVPKAWMRGMFGLEQYVHKIGFGSRFIETGRENMKEWLAAGWADLGCTAILAHNDECAMGVIQTLSGAGLRVPQDVSVVGYDGSDAATGFSPSLSTVVVPLEEIGRKGVALLMEQIQADCKQVGEHVLPTTLQIGDSSALAAPQL